MAQDDIAVRLEQVRERIAKAAQRAGRNPQEIAILGACKQVPAERVLRAIELGVTHVGENRVQEAEAKFKELAALRPAATWHMIGPLQSNKARQAMDLFDVVHALDNLKLARRLNTVAGALHRTLPVYVEVNLAQEATKSGVAIEGLLELAEGIAECASLRLEGLMAVPPDLQPQEVRPYFRKLGEPRDTLQKRKLFRCERPVLSMGMTHDYEVAVEEGSTMVRLGTAIWGPRPA